MAEFNCEACRAELLGNIKSNQHRIGELADKVDNLQEIVICIREIAVEMRGMKEAQDEIKRNQEKSNEEFKRSQELLAAQLRAVEVAPHKSKASYVDKAINGAIAAIVAYIMSRILSR